MLLLLLNVSMGNKSNALYGRVLGYRDLGTPITAISVANGRKRHLHRKKYGR